MLTYFFADAEITGLTPGKEYKFRVMAVNNEGESEPLETATAIVAKNPFGKLQLLSNRSFNLLFNCLISSQFKMNTSVFTIVN